MAIISVIFTAFIGQAKAQQTQPLPLQTLATALKAFSGTQTVSSITLTAQVSRTAGSTHETGTATLLAKSDGSGRIDLALDDGSTSEIYAPFRSMQECERIDKSGRSQSIAVHNCLGAGMWFLPQIVFANAISNSDLTVITDTAHASAIVLRSKYVFNSQTRHLDRLAAVGDRWLYFDPTTNYVSMCVYNRHPEDNGLFNVEHEVIFTDYHVVDGVAIPFHIEHYVQNQLLLDINVQGAAINNQSNQ